MYVVSIRLGLTETKPTVPRATAPKESEFKRVCVNLT